MRKFLYILLVSCVSYSAQGQLDQSLRVTQKVADWIVKNTSYKFVDSKNGKLYERAADAPDSAVLQAASEYNRWQYSNGVMAYGMLRLASSLNDPLYSEYASKNFKFIFDNAPYFEAKYKNQKRSEFHNLFRMDRLDDCGAMGAALLYLNDKEKRKEYTTYLQKAAQHISYRQSREADGTLNRPEPRKMTIWADDLYMSVPFLAVLGRQSGNKTLTDDAIRQVRNFNKYLFDSASGLYYHNWYSDVKANGVAHWLRCNGWIAMAQVELLRNLPANHSARKELIALLQRQILGFSRYQDKSGLWHQLLDKSDSYLETSGTAMFVYAVAAAVNEGWIPKQYINVAENGWTGLRQRVNESGEVADVCIGTGIKDDLAFYYTRPTKLNDFHVSGAFLLAGTEMIRYYRQNSPPTDLKKIPGLSAAWDFRNLEKGGWPAINDRALTLRPFNSPAVVDEGPLSGKSILFNGKTDYLFIPADSCAALTMAKEVTVVAWIKWAGTKGFIAGRWNEYEDGGRRQYGLFTSLPMYNGRDQVCGHISKSGGPTPPFPYSIDYSASRQKVPVNTWVCVGFTYDGKYIKSYLNGIFEAREPELINNTGGFIDKYPEGLTQIKNPYYFPEGIGSKSSDFTVGAVRLKEGMGNAFKGQIGGIAVFNRALAAGEMKLVSDLFITK